MGFHVFSIGIYHILRPALFRLSCAPKNSRDRHSDRVLNSGAITTVEIIFAKVVSEFEKLVLARIVELSVRRGVASPLSGRWDRIGFRLQSTAMSKISPIVRRSLSREEANVGRSSRQTVRLVSTEEVDVNRSIRHNSDVRLNRPGADHCDLGKEDNGQNSSEDGLEEYHDAMCGK